MEGCAAKGRLKGLHDTLNPVRSWVAPAPAPREGQYNGVWNLVRFGYEHDLVQNGFAEVILVGRRLRASL